MEELSTQLTEGLTADPPLPEDEILAAAQAKKTEWALPDTEVVKVTLSVPACLAGLLLLLDDCGGSIWLAFGHTSSPALVCNCGAEALQPAAGCLQPASAASVASCWACSGAGVPAQVVWSALLASLPMGGKNTQQIAANVLKQVRTYRKLLNAFSKGARAEAALIVHVQVGPHPRVLHWLSCQWAGVLPGVLWLLQQQSQPCRHSPPGAPCSCCAAPAPGQLPAGPAEGLGCPRRRPAMRTASCSSCSATSCASCTTTTW